MVQGKITKKTTIKNNSKKYDITTSDNHNFFANKILVHNCTGQNITRNVLKIPNIPKTIKFLDKLVIRGEIILKLSNLKGLPYKNARNGCSGIATRFSGEHCEKLTILIYSLQNILDFNDIQTEIECLTFLENQGFETVTNYYTTLNHVSEIYDEYSNGKREKLDYDIDGLVVKENNINLKNHDFTTEIWRRPKNQIAIKFQSEGEFTKVIDIIDSVSGRTITPIAIVQPVNIGGATIRKASLANYPLAQSKNIGIGCECYLIKANDIIPKIEYVTKKGQDIVVPTKCPACNADLEYDMNEAEEELTALICPYPDCLGKLSQNINKWLKKHEVKNIGDSFIDLLIDKKIVNDLYSFLMLPYNQDALDKLKGFEGIGTKRVNILINGIVSTYKSDIIKFIAGLNIQGFGSRRTEQILNVCKAETVEEFISFINSSKALNVTGFGNEIITSLRKEFIQRRDIINQLLTVVKVDKNDIPSGGPLEGMAFCITGELHTMSRPKAQELVKAYGGKASSSVSKKTTYLVSNDPTSTTGKMKKARTLGVPIITENEFLKFIDKTDLLLDKPEVKDIVSNTNPVDGFDDLLDDLNDLDDSNSDTDNVVSDIMDL